MSSVAASAPPSPVARARCLSPPPAPGRCSRRNSHGQVLVEAVRIVLMSGDLLAEVVRKDAGTMADESWCTGQLRCQVVQNGTVRVFENAQGVHVHVLEGVVRIRDSRDVVQRVRRL